MNVLKTPKKSQDVEYHIKPSFTKKLMVETTNATKEAYRGVKTIAGNVVPRLSMKRIDNNAADRRMAALVVVSPIPNG